MDPKLPQSAQGHGPGINFQVHYPLFLPYYTPFEPQNHGTGIWLQELYVEVVVDAV